MARLPKLLVIADLVNQEALPGTPGVLVHVELHHDRDRGWWEVTTRETTGDRRKTRQRCQDEHDAEAALRQVYAAYEGQGSWHVRDQRHE